MDSSVSAASDEVPGHLATCQQDTGEAISRRPLRHLSLYVAPCCDEAALSG
jgi:hypothetical protein